ncbi:hypothetical protein KIN20_027805, partial [Parelaphostrongylus tenuis]
MSGSDATRTRDTCKKTTPKSRKQEREFNVLMSKEYKLRDSCETIVEAEANITSPFHINLPEKIEDQT